MMWLDCSGLGMEETQLEHFLIYKAKIVLNMGSTFGPGGEGYVRINFATPHSVLMTALERLRDAVHTI